MPAAMPRRAAGRAALSGRGRVGFAARRARADAKLIRTPVNLKSRKARIVDDIDADDLAWRNYDLSCIEPFVHTIAVVNSELDGTLG